MFVVIAFLFRKKNLFHLKNRLKQDNNKKEKQKAPFQLSSSKCKQLQPWLQNVGTL